MKTDIAQQLVALRKEDEEMRARLAKTGALFEGYHPDMEAVHISNALALEGIIAKLGGWPHEGHVGKEGADAAWMIAQHAISLPDFQRKVLLLLKQSESCVPPAQWAHLEDRILVFEGKPQIYGTQFDWDDKGVLNPKPIADIKNVDARRAGVGLPPLQDAIDKIRARSKAENESGPQDLQKRNKEFEIWVRKVGWR